jgi:hypothetical protein
MVEWQDGGGHWNCADTSDIKKGSSFWWRPARMLNISPKEYVQMLIDVYKVDYITFFEETNMVYFRWDNQANMRRYKNDMNREARNRRYEI